MNNEYTFLNSSRVDNAIKNSDLIACIDILLGYKEFCDSQIRLDVFSVVLESYLDDLTREKNTNIISLEDVKEFLTTFQCDKEWSEDIKEVIEYFFDHNNSYTRMSDYPINPRNDRVFIVKK